jgi:CBS domain-containing protein
VHVETILARKGREVRTVHPDTIVSEAMRRLREERIGAPVVSADGARVTGLLTDRRIHNALVDHGVGALDRRVEEVMTREVLTCAPGDRVAAVMGLMTERRVRSMPVVGEDGRLRGIVSLGDAVEHRLEEMRHEVEALREHIRSIVRPATARRAPSAAALLSAPSSRTSRPARPAPARARASPPRAEPWSPGPGRAGRRRARRA